MKEGLAHAVKLEGGTAMVPRRAPDHGRHPRHGARRVHARRASTSSAATGSRVAATRPTPSSTRRGPCRTAGAFAVVLEMVPAPVAARVTEVLSIPTIGIGAGNGTDAQVLVWSDFAGLRSGKAPRFVKKYADLRGTLLDAARAYAADVESGAFPDAEHSFES